ncbi:LysR family transcriptional regulator [Micromonospora endolithica]|uniref:LysR family transcriptional regulator n=1 Tax=Micromonospora endolithica TaxID=230091 RepID=A0A3A9ZJW4_9ACTN|nr:LysR family transcriptional regulator [Micromonospora endolithica]RKN47707.1 LysR family transcriptional regulator [Micromonospora endolithica]TWJ21380.1 regulatory helix-turn-helix LysR family protein [Micromonospora endolithica]
MKWQELHSFVAVAEEESFTGAARRLGVSQPEVSRRVRQLERQVGAKLVQRTTRQVTITAAGREVLRWALGTIDSWERVNRRLDGYRDDDGPRRSDAIDTDPDQK